MKFLPALTILALLTGCKKSGPASSMAANEADAVFVRYNEAVGGLDASRAITNMRIDAEIEVPAQAVKMRMVIYEERPDRSRFEAEVPALGTLLSGHANGIAWEMNPMMGPIVKQGAEAEQVARRSRLDLFEDFTRHWTHRTLAGTVEYAGERCHQIDATTSAGVSESLFFSVESGLYMGTRTVVRNDMGELPVENIVEKYEEVDGILVPSVTRQKAGPIDTITRFTAIQTNLEDFPDLSPPPEILELVAQ